MMQVKRLKRRIFVWLIIVILRCVAYAAEESVPIAALESGRVKINGVLGYPVGTLLTIEAVVDRVPDTLPGTPKSYRLRVETVDQKTLRFPIFIPFELFPAAQLNLAVDEFQLRRVAERLIPLPPEGSKPIDFIPPEVSYEKAKDFIETYVGSKHTLIVFEVLEANGIPKNYPADLPVLALPPFRFHSYLMVVNEVINLGGRRK